MSLLHNPIAATMGRISSSMDVIQERTLIAEDKEECDSKCRLPAPTPDIHCNRKTIAHVLVDPISK